MDAENQDLWTEFDAVQYQRAEQTQVAGEDFGDLSDLERQTLIEQAASARESGARKPASRWQAAAEFMVKCLSHSSAYYFLTRPPRQ